MKPKTLVIEDFDDCLVEDTTKLNHQRYLDTFKELGYSRENVDLLGLIQEVHGAGVYGKGLVRNVGKRTGFDLNDEQVDKIYSHGREIYLFKFPKLTKTTELATVTKEIYDNHPHIIFAIATDNYSTLFVQHVLHFHKLTHLFAMVVNADKNERYVPRKPDPKMLDVVMGGLQFAPEESIYVGDCEKDELTAENANIDYVHWQEFCKNYREILNLLI